MQSYPMGAPVECTDGEAGTSTHVIVNPLNRKIAYLVVKEFKGAERLVPVDQVLASTPKAIQLACAKADLAAMKPFIEHQYVTGSVQMPPQAIAGLGSGMFGYTYYLPYGVTSHVAQTYVTENLNIPEGMLAVERGMKVSALDGEVGEVDELLVDPASGQVTHFVLKKGHAFGKKEMALPVTAIQRVESGQVYLNLDKDSLGQLPAIPSKRLYYGGPDVIHFVAVTFDFVKAADQVLEHIKIRSQEGTLQVVGGVLLKTSAKGKTTQKAINVSARRSRRAMKGLLIGGLASALLPGVGLLAGALIGGLAGAATAPGLMKGLPPEMVEKLKASIKPDTSALLLLVEERWMSGLTSLLKQFNGQIIDQLLSDEIVEELIAQVKGESTDASEVAPVEASAVVESAAEPTAEAGEPRDETLAWASSEPTSSTSASTDAVQPGSPQPPGGE